MDNPTRLENGDEGLTNDPVQAGRLSGFPHIDRNLLELLPVAVCCCDREGVLLQCNQRAVELWGRQPRLGDPQERFCGSHRLLTLQGTHVPHADCPMATALRTGQPQCNVEAIVERPDGSRRCALLNIQPIRDASGAVVGAVNVFQDITQRKAAEAEQHSADRHKDELLEAVQAAHRALQETEQRLRNLSNNLPHGAIYQVGGSPEGKRFLYLSDGIERILGISAAEAMRDANAMYGLIHEGDIARVAAAEEQSVRQFAPFDCEFRSYTRSGQVKWLHCRSAPRDLPTGEIIWEGIILDVTERKAAAEALDRERERHEQSLHDADRRKDEFLATLAHELRNPLAPLRNGLQIMKISGQDAGAVEQVRDMMDRQLLQMVRLIDDLLDVSRITRGKLELRRERIELTKVVQNAIESCRPTIEAFGHQFTVSLPTMPVMLDVDPIRMAQVFGNLLVNAAKYTDRGGHISLTAERAGRDVLVSVSDTGIGIPPEHLPRLFEMFSQVAPALDRAQGGLGIGLSLARGLVEMHGGALEARSGGTGRGSEFIVRLPTADPEPIREVPRSAGEASKSAPRRRILVADDNRDGAESLAIMLRLAGHEVHTTHDGQAAVEAAAWFRPDVALLDIGMPILNGLEVARRIRAEPWGQKMLLVATTGWGQDEDKRRSKEAGFDEHLVKPVDLGALRTLLAGCGAVR